MTFLFGASVCRGAEPLNDGVAAPMAGYYRDLGYETYIARPDEGLIIGIARAPGFEAGKTTVPAARIGGRIYFGVVELYDGVTAKDRQPGSALDRAARVLAINGPDGAAGLNGDFALGVFDPHSRALTLMRDHFGARSVYVSEVRGHIYFASSVPALLRLSEVGRDLDQTALAYFLLYGYPGRDKTYYKEIRALLPSHLIEFTGTGGTRQRRYWTPAARGLEGIPSHARLDTFCELMARAITERVPANGATGILLSGGLDSSLIAGVLCSEFRERDIRSITAVAPQDVMAADGNERSYIHALKSRYPNLQIQFDDSDDVAPEDALNDTACLQAGPVNNAFLPLTRAMLRRLAAQGVRTVFDGDGGDICVSYFGASAITDHVLHLRLAEAWAEAQRLRYAEHMSSVAIVRQCLIGPFMPLPVLQLWWDWRRNNRVGHSALAARAFDQLRIREWMAECGRYCVSRNSKSVHEEMIAELTSATEHDGMAGWDTSTVDLFLNYRQPFYDPRAIEAALSLPAPAFVCGAEGRLLSRAVSKGIVPDEIRLRRDKGHAQPAYRSKMAQSRDRLRTALAQFSEIDLWHYLVDVRKVDEGLAELERPFANASGDLSSNTGDVEIMEKVWRPYQLGRFLSVYGS